MICSTCQGTGWVCEDHRHHAWAGLADVEPCCGGAGSPCGSCNLEMACAGWVSDERAVIMAWLNEQVHQGFEKADDATRGSVREDRLIAGIVALKRAIKAISCGDHLLSQVRGGE